MSKTVLTVDDSRTMRDMLQVALTSAGYAVTQAEDGQQGLDVLAGSQPDVIITDIDMPRLDGFGFIEGVRCDSRMRAVPILVLSTESDGDEKQRARQAGAHRLDRQALLSRRAPAAAAIPPRRAERRGTGTLPRAAIRPPSRTPRMKEPLMDAITPPSLVEAHGPVDWGEVDASLLVQRVGRELQGLSVFLGAVGRLRIGREPLDLDGVAATLTIASLGERLAGRAPGIASGEIDLF